LNTIAILTAFHNNVPNGGLKIKKTEPSNKQDRPVFGDIENLALPSGLEASGQ
jgi:hypothetical protein